MYAEFFGFRELPFNNTPDPRFFFSTPDHEEALATLVYAVKERKGFVLLTGEVGTGKTLLTRMMLRHFGAHISFATINHAVSTSQDLMESICTEFELSTRPDASATQRIRRLHDFLLAQFAQNLPVVLVLDEAQNLPVAAFEQLRMIGNLEADDAKLLQIVIVGQPELQQMFLSPQLRQLRQRLFRRYHLPALDRIYTERYIRHRLTIVCDRPDEIFDEGAMDAIYRASGGLPRLINTICDNVLLSAYSADRKTINGDFVDSVVRQMMLPAPGEPGEGAGTGPLVPIGSPFAAPSESTASPEMETGHEEASADLDESRPREPRPEPADPGDNATRRPSVTWPTGVRAAPRATTTNVGRRIEELARRFARLEEWLRGVGSHQRVVHRVESSLRPLVEEGQKTAARLQVVSRDVTRHESELRTLHTSVRTVVRDLRLLLDRTRTAVTECTRAEHRARNARRELMDLLRKIESVRNMHPLDPSLATSPPLRTEAAATTEETSGAARRPGLGPDQLQELLHSARHSLSELRGWASDDRGGEADRRLRKQPATDALEEQVSALAELVESETGGS